MPGIGVPTFFAILRKSEPTPHLKTWLAGTHHGVGEQHLQHYLNEHVFRFNRRRAPMAAFQSLLGFASQHEPTTYNMLYDGELTG